MSVVKVDKNAVVSLQEITLDNINAIYKLRVAPEQQNSVAPNGASMAQAYYVDDAWYRAIYADDVPVGFVMLYDTPHRKAEYYLWRMMIDARYQGLGFGRKAMALIVDYVKQRPYATELGTSCVPAAYGGPEHFYLQLGFEPTGEMDDDEMVMRLRLDSPAEPPNTEDDNMPLVTLRRITAETVRAICRLKVAEQQDAFVASNEYSFMQANFRPDLTVRAIYADEEPVGFIMFEDNPHKGVYFLWRLMVDHKHQGKGYGQEGMRLLLEYVKKRPLAKTLRTSCVPGPLGPESFYLHLGFVPTGQMLGDEVELSFALV